KKGNENFFTGAIAAFRAEATKRKERRGALACDLLSFIATFFFARRHIIFGVYPLGTALLSALPSRVWICALGAICGSLSLGRSGLIHAAVSLIILFLRIIISSGKIGGSGESLFKEPLIMRLSAATIGSFVGAGYEMLLSAFTLTSVLFGVCTVLSTLVFTLIFSGLFLTDISAEELLLSDGTIFKKKRKKDDYGILFFEISAAICIFLFGYSLKEYDYFGISPAYLYSVAITLFASKRFGAIRGMSVGFISCVGVSALYAPASALLGAVSALLYPFGIGYALIGAGAAFCLWGAYAGGAFGFLSLLSEYMIAALLVSGALKKAPTEKEEEVRASLIASAEEMVGASWLSHKAQSKYLCVLEEALLLCAERIKRFSERDSSLDFDGYRRICSDAFSEANIPKNQEIINIISTKLYKKQKFSNEEQEAFEMHGVPKSLIDTVLLRAAERERELYAKKKSRLTSEQYTLLSKMLNEAKRKEDLSRSLNEDMTKRATEVFIGYGFAEGCIKVFGDERIRVIGAGLDKDGTLITSPELKRALEEALGIRLGSYEYFRRGDMALFKAMGAAAYSAKCATSRGVGRRGEVSGDSALYFSTDTEFYSVISDGMGSGRAARESADLVTAYLSDMLSAGVSQSSAISSLSAILRSREGESTASVDIFSLDLVRGDATFVKCGAAPSFVKRGSSIFRMRSESAPIGLLASIDAEKIRVEIKPGDIVVMLSDGVASCVEDSAWLLTFMSENDPIDLQKYADEIIKRAALHRPDGDDMTVSVIKVERIY
ncbi:MAG: SpoIIE family protein phosphatase, partial [Clostridia bacterium]|nr:SpoIIE family protein phosphatase [Clostridia bacterium]